ncbi:MAG: 1-deoxy-D-xylulose-5-phosphate synthase [Candidatus Omnitrophica bacterium 4484_213]|nr:MAG: 1-deoxy-D-xylulose-5-phosphate synthase [Candidatus Omnitrophica bacterium 4484_213]
MSLLEKINNPQDLKKLDINELPLLAKEIRREIIEVVSKNGGHLASNLGVVELTICLHYLLSCPQDKILWDVGHQCYTHKLLTGRRNSFKSLRQLNGLSGFPNPEESPCDPFIVGHSGTAVSQALGITVGQALQKEKGKVVAVIGDGSLTSGMVFEGMSNVAHQKRNLVVILNDNEMAISKSAGILSNYLNRMISSSTYNKVKENLSSLIKSIPRIGTKVLNLAERLDESLKGLLVPGVFFEQLGFRYFGPLNGHNIPMLLKTLRNVFTLPEPGLVHIITKKGKGYRFAEQSPERFHSASPFNIKTGEFRLLEKFTKQSKNRIRSIEEQAKDSLTGFTPKQSPTYTDIFGESLVELGREDENVVAITAAMELGTGLSRFRKEFPSRFFDVGIAEQHAVTFAGGLCKQGLKPFVAIYSTFLQRAYDQIIHDICLQNLPVIFIVSNAGIVGEDGPTHQGVFDFAYLGGLPNLSVLAAKDGEELKEMLRFAVRQERGPIAIRYPKTTVGSWQLAPKDPERQAYGTGKPTGQAVGNQRQKIELGKAEVMREGKEAMIISIGSMVYPSLKASSILIKEAFITVEEHSLQGGLGSKVLECFADRDIKVGIKRIGLPDKFIEQGRREELLLRYGLHAEGIAEEIKKWMGR